MTKRLIILLLSLPLLSSGQGSDVLRSLVATSDARNLNSAEAKVDGFIADLKNISPQNDVARLKKIFQKTQREFLREYVQYSDFSEIFDAGRYDCLTATSLYSVILTETGFQYSIIETNYHIFLLVKTSKGDILLETTDRFDGFVTSARQIRQRIGAYRSSVDEKNQTIFRYRCNLYDEVSQNELPGLLYYNQAVKAYNSGSLEKCAQLLIKARSIYNTPRINEFGSLLLKAVVESGLDEAAKFRIIRQFKGISHSESTVLASR